MSNLHLTSVLNIFNYYVLRGLNYMLNYILPDKMYKSTNHQISAYGQQIFRLHDTKFRMLREFLMQNDWL